MTPDRLVCAIGPSTNDTPACSVARNFRTAVNCSNTPEPRTYDRGRRSAPRAVGWPIGSDRDPTTIGLSPPVTTPSSSRRLRRDCRRPGTGSAMEFDLTDSPPPPAAPGSRSRGSCRSARLLSRCGTPGVDPEKVTVPERDQTPPDPEYENGEPHRRRAREGDRHPDQGQAKHTEPAEPGNEGDSGNEVDDRLGRRHAGSALATSLRQKGLPVDRPARPEHA